ncbi:MAG: hypothetical protein IJP49_11290 [Bacteroidales bacterium]|nr:hypothetical protein [Bacteroidales bacterium]
MKKILSVLFLFMICLAGPVAASAQSDYKSFVKNGDHAVSKSDYVEAVKQYDGALAMMKMKKMNPNSVEYLEVQKKLNNAKDCIAWNKAVKDGISDLSEDRILARFERAVSEEDMDRIKNELLEKVRKVRANADNIVRRFPTDKIAKGRKDQCDRLAAKINDARESQEELLVWVRYRDRRSLEAYDDFLSQYPNGKYSQAAKDSIRSIQENQAWASIRSYATESLMQEYIRNFPEGKHIAEVKSQLAQYQARRQDENAWEEAVRTGSSTAFRRYSTQFPQGYHRSEADRRYQEALVKEDDNAWEEAESASTVAAYKDYLSRYPQGRHTADARKGQDRVNDRKLWERYSKTDTKEAYGAYLNETKMNLYASEARKRISEIEAAERQAEDDALWAAAVKYNTVESLQNYLRTSRLKTHEKEANKQISVKKARALNAAGSDPEKLVEAYAEAEALGALEPQDRVDYYNAKDEAAHARYKQNPTVEQGKKYIASFPDGKHFADVSDAIAMALADRFAWQALERDYQAAYAYAVSPKAKSYVDEQHEKVRKEHEKELRKIQRQNSREALHFLMGVGVETVFDEFSTFTNSLGNGMIPNFGMKAALSLGGHSNRFNLELAGTLYNSLESELFGPANPYYKFRVSATPKVNVIKKQNLGGEYSLGYLYFGPEVSYDIYAEDSGFSKPCLSVGGKVGFGLTLFDFYVGYHYIVSGSDQYYSRYDSVNDVYYYDDLRAPGHYLSFGIMMYLGSK